MQGLTLEVQPQRTGVRKMQATPRQKNHSALNSRGEETGSKQALYRIEERVPLQKTEFILLKERVKQFQKRGRHSRCGCFQTRQRNLSRLSSRAALLQVPGKKDKGVPCSL